MAALCGFLLWRLWPDVDSKPLYEDEAIAGLIGMRPLQEVLETVVLDRGGAPLHFVLAHAAFWVEPSYAALRWVSVLAALAAVPLCFDLGRRLGGTGAGLIAAAVAASSTALSVYGTFGRMYALFVFAAALFADLFVSALRRPTTATVGAAAAAGWLLPAVHPYGAIPAGVALLAAAAVWRGRGPLRAAWPVAVAAALALPFLYADLRLADRASIATEGERLASPTGAWTELVSAVSAFAGGDGLPLVFFTALGLLGVAVLLRREPAVAVVGASIAVPPLLFLVVRSDAAPDLSPRHLFYALPFWAAAIGVGAAALTRWAPVVAVIALVAVVSPPSALRDPRNIDFATADPASPPELTAERGDVLLPYSAVFLAALPDVREAVVLPHADGEDIIRTLEHAEEPVGAVHLAIPTKPWTLIRIGGPFTKAEAVEAAARRLHEFDRTPELRDWFEWIEPGLCDALNRLDRECP